MNALVKFNDQLPDFLRDPALFAANDAAAGGISGGRLPSLSIRGSRFHLVDEAGTDQMVNALTLDVVFLWANPVVSKTYYAAKWDPNAEAVPPTCYSDNGVAPSVNAEVPQHPRCAGCAKGAWGSAQSAASGKDIKACSDSKKVALVLATQVQTVTDNLMGTLGPATQAYQLRVSATAMRPFADMVKLVKARGVPLVGVVVRLGFDSAASYPLLTFTPVGMITAELYGKIKPLLDDADTLKTLVGENDSPLGDGAAAIDPAKLPAALQQLSQPSVLSPSPPIQPIPAATGATNGAAHPPEHVPPVRPRGRPAKQQATVQAAVDAGLVAQAPAPTTVPPPTPQPTPPPPQPTQQAASTVVPQASVAATSASVDALLDGLFGPK